jgi:hypothetical protein
VYEFGEEDYASSNAVRRRVPGVPEDPLLSSSISSSHSLCRPCQHNQTILIQMLSNFDPPATAPESTYEQYRRDLERRYPLCQVCRFAVEQRLGQLEAKLKARRLRGMVAGSGGSSEKAAMVQRVVEGGRKVARQRRLRATGRLVIGLARLSFDALLLLQSHGHPLPHVEHIMASHPFDRALPADKKVLMAMTVFLGVVDFARTTPPLLGPLMTLLRLFVLLVPAEARYLRAAMLVMGILDLWLLLRPQRPPKRRANWNPETSEVRRSEPMPTPMDVDQPPVVSRLGRVESDASPSKAITKDILETDWGLGSSSHQRASASSGSGSAESLNPISLGNAAAHNPNNPLLPGNLKPRAPYFPPSRLDPAKAIQTLPSPSSQVLQASHPMVYRLKPSVMETAKPSGLESSLESFSLCGKPSSNNGFVSSFFPSSVPKPTTAFPSSSSSASPPTTASYHPSSLMMTPSLWMYGQIGLTGLLLALRLLLAEKTGLLPVILATSFCLRGFIWRGLGDTLRTAGTAMACLRLAWLAGILTEPLLAEAYATRVELRLVGLAMDLAILASR